MQETVKLNLYDVDRCGYYEDNSDQREFCNLNELLADLNRWIEGKELQLTKTYGKEDYDNKLPTYCLDLIRDGTTGDFLLTTWNQTPADQGNYASINLSSSVGQYDLDIQDIPDGYVPGYPTYFWFLPKFSKFCTIRFNQPLNGHPNLKLYLKSYLKNYSGWVFDDGGQKERTILGYGIKESDISNLNPIYESRPSVKAGSRHYLINNALSIRKVMRKNRLIYQNQDNINFVNNMFNKIGIKNDRTPKVDYNDIKYEIDRGFTVEEVETVYDYWIENMRENDNHLDDIGFKFTGNHEDYWLSRIIQKQEFEIDVIRRQEEVVDAESLLSELIARTRTQILALFR